MRFALLALASLSLAACGPKADRPPSPPQDQAETGKGVDRSHRGQKAPDAAFKDGEGEDVTLEEFEGRPVLVNLWATWCAPCVKELPTLAKLQASGSAVQVAAVSQDTGPQASVAAFLAKAKAGGLVPYHDPDMKLSSALGAQVLPTTVLYDSNGFEAWRYVGDLDWTSSEAARLLSEDGARSAASGR